ncbi:MAG: hypothetical protein M1830_000637 [Pleopsidium flavum]|nr:MAG: hypothetical protein M1830_000637 [Pleopsidium flavum]
MVSRGLSDAAVSPRCISTPQSSTQAQTMPPHLEIVNNAIVPEGLFDPTSEFDLRPTTGLAYNHTKRRRPDSRQNTPLQKPEPSKTGQHTPKTATRRVLPPQSPLDTATSSENKVRNTPSKTITPRMDSRSFVSYKGVEGTLVIDLDKEDEIEENAAKVDLMQEEDYKDLFLPPRETKHGCYTSNSVRAFPVAFQRNGPTEGSFDTLERFSSDNRTLKAGKTVELSDGDFLRITLILCDRASTEVFLRGHRFRRVKRLNGVLELKLNELAMVLEVEHSDPRNAMVQGVEQIPLSQVGRVRELITTNRPYPELSFRTLDQRYFCDEYISNNCRLVCRWKYILSFKTARDRELNKDCEKCIARFRATEIENGLSVSDTTLRQNWRGDTINGGACTGLSAEEDEFDRREMIISRASEILSSEPRSHVPGSISSCQNGSEIRRKSSGTRPREFLPKTAAANGSISYPILLDEDEDEPVISTAPTVQTNVSSLNSERQVILDITGDRSPRISLKASSFCESQNTPSEHKLVHSSGTRILSSQQSTSSSHGASAVLHSQRTSSPDIIEINAQITTKSKRGILKTEYIGALPFIDSPSTPCTKRIKTLASTVVTPTLANSNSRSSGRQFKQIGMLWSTSPVPWPLPRHRKSASPAASDRTMSPEALFQNEDQAKTFRATACLEPVAQEFLKQEVSPRKGSRSETLQHKQRYTFGDAFCGAGGTSRGAKGAGFHVEWGFDFDPAAITSYQLNFYNAKCIVAWAHDFAEISVGDESKVDVLHLSPPCQVFSFAHTVDGKDDEMNSATFFAVVEVVKRTRPRVVTLENTSGLAVLHPLWLNKAMHFFTSLGFSVRWKIMNFAEYGLPQARKRLIIFASCPGECLPPFPEPTHGAVSNPFARSGLAPLVTVKDVISTIPRGFPNHDPEAARPRSEPPYPADEPLRSCITTSGGGNIHPSGKRDLTHREFACLQGFPLEHKFGPVRVKKQIGNAVPPSIAKVLFEEIKKALLKADGL